MKLTVIDKDLASIRLTVDKDEVRLKFPPLTDWQTRLNIQCMVGDFFDWLRDNPQEKTLRGIVFCDKGEARCFLFTNAQMGKGHKDWALCLVWQASYGLFVEVQNDNESRD